MNELNPLLTDLALILLVAGVVTIIFKALKQPVVLGYIIAGLLTGPYVSFIPTVTEISSVEFWGDIGVIFLLFCLGLEFSFKKIVKVGGPGAMSVLAEVIMMFSMGFLVGWIFGWNTMTSIFLGAILAISSTSIIVKTFDDLGIGNKKSSHLTIGSLIFDDLVAILLMVLLPTLVISKTFNGAELLSKIFYIAIFLLLWFTGGIYLIPSLFRKLKKYLTSETLIVISLGLCFLMVVVTVKAEISEALGAFVMGSILSGTIQRDKIVTLTKPIKDFFGAIFFVSVGMLVDPTILLHYWPHILVISFVLLVIKPISLIVGFLFSGQTLKVAIPAGICLCQIGEFSYIIAQLGKELEATPDYLYPIVVAVSIITTFATPYWIKIGDKMYDYIYKHSRPSWRKVIEKLGTGQKTFNQQANWSKLLKSYFTRVFIYSAWGATVGLICIGFVYPYIQKLLGNALWVRILMLLITLIAMSPFIWALLKKKDKDELYDKIWEDQRFYRGPLMFMVAFKYILAIIAVATVASIYITAPTGFIFLLGAVILVVVVLSNHIKKYYGRIENRFLTNLNSEGGHRFIIPRDMANEMHMEKCIIGSTSYLAGKTIGQTHRDKDTGALVIQINRGGLIIDLPHKDEVFYPSDEIMLLGSDSQLKSFILLSENNKNVEEYSENRKDAIEMKLFQITLNKRSPLVGEGANITSLRDKFGVLIIGVEKNGEDSFLRPTSSVLIEENDTVWLVGNKESISRLNVE